ncbi:MAG: cobalt-precorrin-5B (C(1))-methyltransferase CbiD [Proteobacteria bacterium]|nr:cobalt-precorrin-5B (C(1))-methyltransferase CbiD [Pseudomonadota bacterium]MBU1584633.1 cobalt-precorrin-5B (C(1))-methyltransferase CbiD [Pseudomonadota bacterium]MBU2453636.1 cobalt-precorrin-5B (C(1))-methyltransferase CbiD [Pseudomonadota bacterium]MBU2627252.1 cobalt-precorrin-5B (C(1))-methyltransferase CbiD [Pseudomonadota bacterium]
MSSRTLKKGFTTGAAAAAAVKAALISFFSQAPTAVEICFLTGEKKQIEIKSVKKLAENKVEAIVVKDAGDDPDITHKAQIGARITLSDSKEPVVNILGGKGVGTITKPGLELPVGEPAINPGPRTMIQHSVKEVFALFNIQQKQVDIEIFVPEGEALAKKTLNARLGILGGISILGTTGIVTPMSHDAYIATIKSGIFVAAATGLDTLVFTTGRRSERFAMEKFKSFDDQAFIQTGDFFKASLDMTVLNPKIKTIIYTVFFGKAVKMALGFEHTHAAKSELTLKKLAGWAVEITGNPALEKQITSANTARHAFSFIYPDYPELITCVGKKIKETAERFSCRKLAIRVLILDFEGKVAFDSREDSFPTL